MPTIAIIEGVRIMIFANDHPPPHFHARFAEHDAQISIATGDILNGTLPRAKLDAVRAWFRPRQEQLAYLWFEMRRGRWSGGLVE